MTTGSRGAPACREILARDPEDEIALGTLSDALLELGRYERPPGRAAWHDESEAGNCDSRRGSYIR